MTKATRDALTAVSRILRDSGWGEEEVGGQGGPGERGGRHLRDRVTHEEAGGQGGAGEEEFLTPPAGLNTHPRSLDGVNE